MITLCEIGEVLFPLLDTNVFPCKVRDINIYCCGHAFSSESQIWKFHIVFWRTTSENCTNERAALAGWQFPHPTNQIIDLWRCRRRYRRQILNSLFGRPDLVSLLAFPKSGKALAPGTQGTNDKRIERIRTKLQNLKYCHVLVYVVETYLASQWCYRWRKKISSFWPGVLIFEVVSRMTTMVVRFSNNSACHVE